MLSMSTPMDGHVTICSDRSPYLRSNVVNDAKYASGLPPLCMPTRMPTTVMRTAQGTVGYAGMSTNSAAKLAAKNANVRPCISVGV